MRHRTLPAALLVLLLLICLQPVQAQRQRLKVIGQVIDSETELPLYMANVFISNSTLGTASDRSGRFSIERIPPGRYTLVVSMMGYETVRQPIEVIPGQSTRYLLKMNTKVIEGQAVTITAGIDHEWQASLKLFKEYFLGYSENAEKCRILNAEFLYFESRKEGAFCAKSHRPLVVENNALGYRIVFHMNALTMTQNRHVHFDGETYFQEMEAEDNEQMERWKKNRSDTYKGSLQHFLRAAAGRRVNAEGFEVQSLNGLPFTRLHVMGWPINLDTLCYQTDEYYMAMLKLPEYLQVIYVRETEPDFYTTIRNKWERSLHQTFVNGLYVEPSHPESFLHVHVKSLLINHMGIPFVPLVTTSYGYWAWLRMADMMPLNYEPLGGLSIEDAPLWRETYISRADLLKKLSPRELIRRGFRQAEKDSVFAATEAFYAGLSRLGNSAYTDTIMETMYDLFTADERSKYKRAKDHGRFLLKKWKRLDTTPATQENERFAEHMQRLKYAKQHYSSPQPRGYDDRGMIYVRYGQPDNVVFQRSHAHLYPHEGWAYYDYDEPITFVFVMQGALYRLKNGNMGIAVAPRGVVSKRESQDLHLIDFFRTLSPLHPAYMAIAEGLAMTGNDHGDADVAELMERVRMVEQAALNLPHTTTRLVHSNPWELKCNTARFIRDGATTFECYFALPIKDLTPMPRALPPQTSLRICCTVEDGGDKPYEQIDETARIPIDSTKMGLDLQGQFNLKVPPGASRCAISISDVHGAKVFQSVLEIKGFDPSQSHLEISDLQLAAAVDPAPPRVPSWQQRYVKQGLIVQPYAYSEIQQDRIIYLYCEAYNLNLDYDGRSRYIVSYRIFKKEGLLSRLNPFKKRGSLVSSSFNLRGSARTEPVYFAVDMGKLASGHYRIEMIVVDELSQREKIASRNIEIVQ